MAFDTKSAILKAINDTSDQSMKTVLLLLFGVFEELGQKIDSVLTNERALRETVLNGHEPVHHDHHVWLAGRIKRDDEVDAIVTWAKSQMEGQKEVKRWRMDVSKSVIAAAIIAAGSFLAGRAIGAEDVRFCGEPARDVAGVIIRSEKVRSNFQKLYPCPETGKTSGACPGWEKDHVIPLACGGCDTVENMQWLKSTIKSCAGAECKDRWERKIYCRP